MPNTGYAGLPYPTAADTPNIPAHIQALAVAADNRFAPDAYNLTMASGWTATNLVSFIDGSGFKHISGWAQNSLTFTPVGGEAIFILPPAMRPAFNRFFPVPVSVGHTVIHVDFNTDGWVRISRPYGSSIPNSAVWGFDHVVYL